jgi:hypothetical protein
MIMASYDQPGFNSPLPGNPGFDAHDSAMTAPGSQGIKASDNFGVVIGNPVVSAVGVSTQSPQGQQTVAVQAGDALGMSSDSVVPPSGGDPLSGVPLDFVAGTGAGEGHVVTPRHPGARP